GTGARRGHRPYRRRGAPRPDPGRDPGGARRAADLAAVVPDPRHALAARHVRPGLGSYWALIPPSMKVPRRRSPPGSNHAVPLPTNRPRPTSYPSRPTDPDRPPGLERPSMTEAEPTADATIRPLGPPSPVPPGAVRLYGSQYDMENPARLYGELREEHG